MGAGICFPSADLTGEFGAGLEVGNNMGLDHVRCFLGNVARHFTSAQLGAKAAEGANVNGFTFNNIFPDDLEKGFNDRAAQVGIPLSLLTDAPD